MCASVVVNKVDDEVEKLPLGLVSWSLVTQ